MSNDTPDYQQKGESVYRYVLRQLSLPNVRLRILGRTLSWARRMELGRDGLVTVSVEPDTKRVISNGKWLVFGWTFNKLIRAKLIEPDLELTKGSEETYWKIAQK